LTGYYSTAVQRAFVKPAERLRRLRLRLGMTTREVEEQSQRIADALANPEFYLSNAWLTKLENTDRVPSIHKLATLSVIYGVKYSDLLLLFGIDLELIGKRQSEVPHQQTHLVTVKNDDPDKPIVFPIRFDPGLNLNRTNLLSRMVEQWGEVPIALIEHLSLRNSHYGFIGLQDFTLYPLLRPGSFVQIDPRLRKIQSLRWRTEFDRPVYFLELRDRYACGWCEVQGNKLTLLPHPLSACTIKRFEFPGEVEIVGQVTGVAMRLAGIDTAIPRLPKHH
jgi:transcriptional regulator with XRE-family HTH domain